MSVVKVNQQDFERYQMFVARHVAASPTEAEYLLKLARNILGYSVPVFMAPPEGDEKPEKAPALESKPIKPPKRKRGRPRKVRNDDPKIPGVA